MTRFSQRARRLAAVVILLVATALVPAAALADDAASTYECVGGHEVSSGLIAQAQSRLQGSSAISLASELESVGNIDSDSNGSTSYVTNKPLGLSTTGSVRSVIIRVSFPASEDGSEQAMTFPESETDDDILSTFNAPADTSSEFYPYESVRAYYERSSLGKLDMQATGVYTYTAQHSRSYYANGDTPYALFSETLKALDDQIDFSQLDANDDGYIDAIYFEYAGANGEWSTTWWPKMNTALGSGSLADLRLDGKCVDEFVMFSSLTGQFSGRSGNQMLIHEIGHILGLPDLYPNKNTGAGSGSGSFDMMENEVGDQNGFFKLLLGWLSPEDVTYVYTSESGVDVRHGDETTHYDDSATLELTPYTSDALTETGGVIAVSSDKTILEGNLFCTFYLLQFDHYAGNQTVTDNGGNPLGHGVRAFRVMANYNEDVGCFIYDNSFGYSGKQLYEVLDPKLGGTDKEYGAFMRVGDLVSPTTNPSSNILGSEERGYTGVTFEVVSEADDSAQVKFSWTKRSERREFALTLTEDVVVNGVNTFKLKTTWPASFVSNKPDAICMEIDGVKHEVEFYYVDKAGELVVMANFNPGVITSSSTVEIVAGKGVFEIGSDDSGAVVASDELRVPLSVANLTTIESAGNYDSTASNRASECVMSNMATDQSGHAYFFEAYEDQQAPVHQLRLVRLSEDSQSAETVAVDRSAICGDDSGALMMVTDLGDGTAVLSSSWMSVEPSVSSICRNAWIDLSTGEILAIRDSSDLESPNSFFMLGGDLARATLVNRGSSAVVTRYRREGNTVTQLDGIALPKSADVSQFNGAGEAGNDYIYTFGRADGDANAYVVSIYRKADVLSAGADAASVAKVSIPNCVLVADVELSDDKVYVASRNAADGGYTNRLLTYSIDGDLLATASLPTYIGSGAQLEVSDNGAVACTSFKTSIESKKQIYFGYVALYDPTTCEVGEIDVRGIATGTWVGNRWLEVTRDEAAKFKEQAAAMTLRWSFTKEFGTAGGDDDPEPEPTPDPSPEPTPDSGSSTIPSQSSDQQTTRTSKATALPKTGDDAPFLAAALLGGGALALIVRRRLS